MVVIYVLTIIGLNGNVLQEEVVNMPKINTPYVTINGQVFYFDKVVQTAEVADREVVRKYITCIETKPIDTNKVGVLQVERIALNSSYEDMFERLNEFLFENRFTHNIIDIIYQAPYIAVHYTLRNEKEIKIEREQLSLYQNQK